MNGEKFATITSEGMLEDIAEGLPTEERKLALEVHGQAYGPMFDEKLTVAAWKDAHLGYRLGKRPDATRGDGRSRR